MLSREGLVEEAGRRGLAPGKLRGAAREYLQTLALKSLFSRKGSAGLVFLGGTALRFRFDLPRFSEDLDFDSGPMAFSAWKDLLEDASRELSRLGLSVRSSAKEKGSLLCGDMRFSGFLQAYGLATAGNEILRIKIEANRPGYALAAEPAVVSAYGELFPVPFAGSGLMFAEKILALRHREQGRDLYDILFMAGRRWVPDDGVLRARGIKTRAACFPPAWHTCGAIELDRI